MVCFIYQTACNDLCCPASSSRGLSKFGPHGKTSEQEDVYGESLAHPRALNLTGKYTIQGRCDLIRPRLHLVRDKLVFFRNYMWMS